MVANENLNISGGGSSKMGPRKSRGPIKALCAIIAAVFLAVGTCAYAGTALMQQVAQLHDSQRAPRTGTVFKGEDTDYTFASQDVVTLNLNYRYSNTGGLAGIDAAAPQTVELQFKKQADGTYQATWKLPTVEGFRIVLDATELNKYLVKSPTDGMTADEFAEALERGDFDVDIDNKTVYYYQQESNGNHNLNPTYRNRYSDEYNKAWNDARCLRVGGADDADGYYAEAVCGDDATHPGDTSGNHGANALVNPKIEVTLTADQLASAREKGLEITVYYRRNATWYLVKHWVPQVLCGLTNDEITALPDEDKKQVGTEDYVCLDKDTQQGRVGALTRATARTHTDNGNAEGNPYELVQPNAFAQKQIENQTTNNETTVDIFYSAASSYRVIFDTDYTYIPRQQVDLGKKVDFTNDTEPKRTGYTFAGWRYLEKGATANADGTYDDNQYIQLDADNPELTIAKKTIADAKLEETGGVLALHLYPKWTPDDTQVRVIFWTEDLTGTDDVQAFAKGGNTSKYDDKYADYSSAPVTHEPKLGAPDAHYSNVHSFTTTVKTDSSLLATGDSGSRTLLASIQNQVDEEFRDAMDQASDLDVADFYSQAGFEIVHEDEDGINYEATTASGDGKTTIYVYFTRNVYELLFTYYGRAAVGGNPSDYCVAINTNGYSYSNGAAVPGGILNFGYSERHNGGTGTYYSNGWMRANVQDAAAMPVPQTITIRAKYGADLRDVWPVAQSNESVESLDNHGGRGTTARMVSWGTTDGKYCEGGFFNSGKYNAGEPTIMGTYAAMSSEIVADPKKPVTFGDSGNVADSGLRHNLVAYWFNGNISYYRNNHCFEIPDLDVFDMEKVSICNDDTSDPKNFLYLVPINNTAVAKYDFNDLMRVSYEDGQIRYDDPNGAYYAVREYNDKYYAVARQVETVSSNSIEKQNPSARLHMTRANTHADHSTQYADRDGAFDGTTCGTETDPYDLYFYYDRDRYTITYMAPSNNFTTDSEVTLGTVRLPYGAQVTKDAYGFNLDYEDKNDTKKGDGSNKYGWELKNTDDTAELPPTPVCPDRADNGTKPWTFKGWALGPAGVNMQWTMNNETESEAQAGDSFAIESNMRLYAIWAAPSYEVTFHLNGGTIGNSGNDVVESVPANRRYTSTEAIIPRPLRAGYTLEGWYGADENGNITSPETPFDFDQAISEDKHVAAKWSANSMETFSYTIYYVTKDPLDGDEVKDTVRVDENGNITSNGGTTYYVLEKSEQKDQVFNPGSTMAFSAKSQTGYVPNGTSKVLELKEPGDTYNVIFYYDPIVVRQHDVHFVKAGTETDAEPTVIRRYTTSPYQTVTTPRPADVEELIGKGYTLVNKDGDAYISVNDASDLKWIDEDGNAQSVSALAGDNVPDVITYLVQPINYTVAYANADGSPAAAKDALKAVTAPEGTSVNEAAAADKNPTQYTAEESFSVKNPERVWDKETKKWYVFDGWTLGDGTETNPNQADFPSTNSLIVGAGTVGKLTFIANWRVDDSGGTLDGSTNLVVQKSIDGRDWISGDSFSFSLAAKDAETKRAVDEHLILLPDETTVTITNETADHQASFGNITFNKAGTYTFAVTEEVPADDAKIPGIAYDDAELIVTVKVTSDADGSLTVVRVDENDAPTAAPLTFTNTYETPGATFDTDPTAAAALFNKVLDGRDWLAGDSFGFELTPVGGAPMPEDAVNGAKTVTVTGAGKKDGDQVGFGFGDIAFTDDDMAEATANADGTRSKTFSYHVKELGVDGQPGTGGSSNGVTYAKEMATLNVTVTDDLEGNLTAAVAGTVENGVFTNTYESKVNYGAAGGLAITKTLNGHDLVRGQFGFTVKPKDEATARKFRIAQGGEEFTNAQPALNGDKVVVKRLGDGVVFNQADNGKTFSFEVYESRKGGAGYDNDDTRYTVDIAVSDDANTGKLTVTTKVSGGAAGVKTYTYATGDAPATGAARAEVPFVNEYSATGDLGEGAAVKIEAAKTLSGRDLKAGEFNYVVLDAHGATVATGSNVAAGKDQPGKIVFTGINYTTAEIEQAIADGTATKDPDGTYRFEYTVAEQTTSLPEGVTGSVFTFQIVVVVTDNGDGTLSPEVTYPAGSNSLAFQNTYDTHSVGVEFRGAKWLSLEDEALGLTIADIADKYEFKIEAVTPGAPMPDARVAKNGPAGNVTFGNATYTLADAGKTFAYKVTETGSVAGVANDAAAQSGKTFTVTIADNGDGTLEATTNPADGPMFSFNNTYGTTPASSSLTADGGFAIAKTLTGRPITADEFEFRLAMLDGTVVASAKNDANGKVELPAVTFDKPGTYQYVLAEVSGGKKIDGVSYDRSVYLVSALVTDKLDGTLAVAWSVDGATTTSGIMFANKYAVDPASASIVAGKKLDGRNLAAGEFTFELSYGQGGDAKTVTATNDAAGKVVFDPMTFDAAGEYRFKVREVAGKAEGVTYDKKVYEGTVTVTDDGRGSLVAEIAFDNGDEPLFTNVYKKPSSPDAPDNPGGNDGGHDSDGGHDGDGGHDSDGKLVKTGDPFSPMIPGVVAATGALCVIAALVLRKKRR